MPYVIREGAMPMDRDEIRLYRKTGSYLQDQFSRFNGEGEENMFRWVKAEMTMPSFSDIIFAYKSEVYVVVSLSTFKDSIIYPPDRRVLPRMIDLAVKNDLIPCIFPVWNDSSLYKGWNLFDAREYDKSGKIVPIDPIAISSDESKEMSKWELYDFAIQCFKYHLNQEGLKVESWHNVPGIDPQLFFYDKEGKLSWAYIRYRINDEAKEWEESTKALDKRISATPPYDGKGYYVTVDIEPEEGKILRSHPIEFDISDISPSL